MSGSSSFRLELPDHFKRSLLTFETENYGKKEKKGRDEARLFIQGLFERLLEWPNVAANRYEPFPGTTGDALTKDGWVLQKVEFSCPRLNGAAKCGRLIYMVHKQDQLIVAVAIYTHKQFEGRVPDKSLAELVETVAEEHTKRKSQKLIAVRDSKSAPEPEPE